MKAPANTASPPSAKSSPPAEKSSASARSPRPSSAKDSPSSTAKCSCSPGRKTPPTSSSSSLKFINPKDFTVVKTLEVKDGKSPLKNLNELEWIAGEIFANIYQTDRIARISPEDGQVTGWLDLAGLKKQLPKPNRAEVLNGIAHDHATGHLLVTGKYWPQIFEIKVAKK